MTNHSPYASQAYSYIAQHSQSIAIWANIAQVSSTAIGGSISEEITDRYASTLSYAKDLAADQLANQLTHATANYGSGAFFYSIGPGNIRVSTAVQLLDDYVRANVNSDPMGLKRYGYGDSYRISCRMGVFSFDVR